MKYRDMTPEQKEAHKAATRKYYANHREALQANRRKYYLDNREAFIARTRKYITEHQEEQNARMKKYMANDLNYAGKKKSTIRALSRIILLKSHAKLTGYQIHHCFTYEDPGKFIYIPKDLHLKIHQLLRINKISADSDHWIAIRDLVNSSEEYTYIRC